MTFENVNFKAMVSLAVFYQNRQKPAFRAGIPPDRFITSGKRSPIFCVFCCHGRSGCSTVVVIANLVFVPLYHADYGKQI
jgi:hypothetical protein